jgi:hypothetical protein
VQGKQASLIERAFLVVSLAVPQSMRSLVPSNGADRTRWQKCSGDCSLVSGNLRRRFAIVGLARAMKILSGYLIPRHNYITYKYSEY